MSPILENRAEGTVEKIRAKGGEAIAMETDISQDSLLLSTVVAC